MHGEYQRILDTGMERAGVRPFQPEAGEPVFYQAATRQEERRQGRGVDSDLSDEGSSQGQLCPRHGGPQTAAVQQDDIRPERRDIAQAGQA